MNYLLNAFSIQMLDKLPAFVKIEEISKERFRYFVSEKPTIHAVGHKTTADVMSEDLNIPVIANRLNITAKPGDNLFIWQYMGGRLPEGATELPIDATVKYIRIKLTFMDGE